MALKNLVVSNHFYSAVITLLGLAFNRTKKAKKSIAQPSLEEKQRYFDEGKKYAEYLVKELDNEEGLLFLRFYKISCFLYKAK